MSKEKDRKKKIKKIEKDSKKIGTLPVFFHTS